MDLTDEQYKQYKIVEWSHTPITGAGPNANQAVQKKPVCNTVIFTNTGTAIAMIDSTLPILPGQSFTYEGYPGEINIHNYTISWVPGAGLTCSVIMTCKEYAT
jgi:hypothetical protein